MRGLQGGVLDSWIDKGWLLLRHLELFDVGAAEDNVLVHVIRWGYEDAIGLHALAAFGTEGLDIFQANCLLDRVDTG